MISGPVRVRHRPWPPGRVAPRGVVWCNNARARRSNLRCMHACTTSPRQRRFWQIMVTSVPMARVGSPPNDEAVSPRLRAVASGLACVAAIARQPSPTPPPPQCPTQLRQPGRTGKGLLEERLTDWGAPAFQGSSFPRCPAPASSPNVQAPCRPRAGRRCTTSQWTVLPACGPAGNQDPPGGVPSPELPELRVSLALGRHLTNPMSRTPTILTNSPTVSHTHLVAPFCTVAPRLLCKHEK